LAFLTDLCGFVQVPPTTDIIRVIDTLDLINAKAALVWRRAALCPSVDALFQQWTLISARASAMPHPWCFLASAHPIAP
jgi:hypothetical protein